MSVSLNEHPVLMDVPKVQQGILGFVLLAVQILLVDQQ